MKYLLLFLSLVGLSFAQTTQSVSINGIPNQSITANWGSAPSGITLNANSYPCNPTGSSAAGINCQNEVMNVKALGAIGDGTVHPLSSVYGTLGAAQAVYPAAT